MKILVCGGRKFTDKKRIFEYLDKVAELNKIELVIDGGADGADKLAHEWADARGYISVTYWANWKGDGKSAGPIRNKRMLDLGKPDRVIAFPGGPGTANMVALAQGAWIPVVQVAAL
jgi:YspA, cpYpsA-related SLOG family